MPGGVLYSIVTWVLLSGLVLTMLYAACWVIAKAAPRPPLAIFGDFPFVPEEARTAGLGGREAKAVRAQRIRDDIAHRGETYNR